ncbi:MAG: signal transduction histidine kinase [Phenylobacterium sp.]|jgi:signal transduction histidine kinase
MTSEFNAEYGEKGGAGRPIVKPNSGYINQHQNGDVITIISFSSATGQFIVQSDINNVLLNSLFGILTVLFLVCLFAFIKLRQNRLLKAMLSQQTDKLDKKSIQLDQLELNIAILSDIGEEISGSLEFDEILKTLYLRINQLMDATVFLIGLYDEEAQGIDFKLTLENGEHQPLFMMSLDEKDRPAVWCIEHQQPLVINDYAKEHADYFGDMEIPAPKAGEVSKSVIYWPLFVAGRVIGVLSVQSYRKNAYTRQHQDMLSYLASTAAIALDNAQSYLKMEQQKTALEKANEHIRMISEIGLQVNASLDMENILLQLYDNVNTLMDAPIFGIGLYDADKNEIDVRMNVEYGTRYKPYIRDMKDKSRFAVWCIDHCKTVFINDLEVQGEDYISNHEYKQQHWLPTDMEDEDKSKAPQSLIYIPLLIKNKVIGTLSVQSCRKHAFEPVHVDLLTSLASFTATAIENARMFQNLLDTQKQLVEAEKMASLGGLVAGVAHELNTPIGICLTASTTIEYLIDKLSVAKANQKLTRKSFEVFEAEAKDGLGLLTHNLERASHLVTSFKNVAIDQSSDGVSHFTLRTLIADVVTSLQSMLDEKGVVLSLQCNEKWQANTYAGTISQILITLIMKSLAHGFDEAAKTDSEQPAKDAKNNTIKIDVSTAGKNYMIRYKDNGQGIDKSLTERIFEPFFTTKRHQGYTGLGMHVVFNYVTQQLGGTIECYSDKGKGFELLIYFPARHVSND